MSAELNGAVRAFAMANQHTFATRTRSSVAVPVLDHFQRDDDLNLVIRPAASEADYNALYQLRYRVYVEELGFRQRYANPRSRTVRDPFDATAITLVADVDGEIIGTVRTNIASDCDLGPYAMLHRLDELDNVRPEQISVTSKLIVAEQYRNRRVMLRLAHALFGIGVARGVAVDFIDCERRLMPMYFRLGYRQTTDEPFEHPELGPRHPMRLFTDRNYLIQVRSPFVGSLP